MNWQALEPSILLPALLAGLLVLSTHVPLGQRVLKRGIIFIDLAIAQVAGLGAILAGVAGLGIGGWTMQLVAAGAAVLAGLFLTWLESRYPSIQEALIGAMFILAAAASILALSGNPHGGDSLRDLLVGQILWINFAQLWPIAMLYTGLLALWWGYGSARGPVWFYVIFALTVTASVQLVGVYLVFASLILPALATRRQRGSRRLAWGYAIGALGYASGLIVSAMWDLPSGAVIVWTMAIGAVLIGLLLGRRG